MEEKEVDDERGGIFVFVIIISDFYLEFVDFVLFFNLFVL